MFGQSVLSATYRVGKVTFRVLGIDPYPKGRVSTQHREVLGFPSGVLVAVPYRGILIPNVTLSDGVVRLTKVEVNGEAYSTPKAISEVLAVKKAMYQYDLLKQ